MTLHWFHDTLCTLYSIGWQLLPTCLDNGFDDLRMTFMIFWDPLDDIAGCCFDSNDLEGNGNGMTFNLDVMTSSDTKWDWTEVNELWRFWVQLNVIEWYSTDLKVIWWVLTDTEWCWKTYYKRWNITLSWITLKEIG